jgi:hypothetical protein
VDGRQNPDWRFLDVTDGQELRVQFTPSQLISPITKTVNINVKRKGLTIFPQALERNFGEENYAGWESGRDPKYPNGEDLRNEANGNLLTNDNDNDVNTVGAPITRGGNPIDVSSINPDAAGGYAFTGQGLFFDGFVRGENYQDLASQAASVASAGEVLVTTFPRLDVKDGNGNDIFRAAPVGTQGAVTFATNPAFKNYSVSIGGSGSLTVKKALIKFEAAELKDANSKIFGDVLALVDGNGTIKQDALKTNITPLPLNNDFRFGAVGVGWRGWCVCLLVVC